MTKRQVRWKEMLGLVLQSHDGNLWKWQIDGIEYGWAPDGWCIVMEGLDQRRLMYSIRVEGAVGYTMGLHDGKSMASRGNGDKA